MFRYSRLFLSALPLSILGSFLASACGNGDKTQAGELGGSCELDNAQSCASGLVCAESDDGDPVCVLQPGTSCDPETETVTNGGCGDGAICEIPEARTGTTSSNGEGGTSGGDETVCLTTKGGECDLEAPFCAPGFTCAETTEGVSRCYGRVVLRGQVTDSSDASAISGAHVIALDDEGSAVTDVAVSGDEGGYELEVPVLRDENGLPAEGIFTLNGSAQDYQPFPNGARVALPIDVSEAAADGELYVVENALTDISLIALPAGERFSAEGSIVGLSDLSALGGLLVVAQSDAGTFTALSDKNGAFTIFNLPDGDYEVTAYGAGVQVATESLKVDGGEVVSVSLQEEEKQTTTVSGNIQIVNAAGGLETSVILVVRDTFDESIARGEAPRGLRAPASGPVSISGDFVIEGVPEGEYVVLAAYENDQLVRDPDTNISGTDFVYVTVTADDAELSLGDSFKVTEALHIAFPGADGPEAVSEKPLLEWEDDSSEDWYELSVFDAFGDQMGETIQVPGVSGSSTVTHQYDGPLEPGMYYQFRVSSWRQAGNKDPAPISSTEDLKGVFFLPAD